MSKVVVRPILGKCVGSQHLGPTDGKIFGALPIVPDNMVVRGNWQIDDGQPFWVWGYADGTAVKTSAVDIAWQSTKHSDRDMFNQELILKVDQIYTYLGLPKMQEERLMHEINIRSARWVP